MWNQFRATSERARFLLSGSGTLAASNYSGGIDDRVCPQPPKPFVEIEDCASVFPPGLQNRYSNSCLHYLALISFRGCSLNGTFQGGIFYQRWQPLDSICI